MDRSSHWRCSVKEGVRKRPATLLKRDSCEFCEISKNTSGRLILCGLISETYEEWLHSRIFHKINLSIFYCDYFIVSLAGWFKNTSRDYVCLGKKYVRSLELSSYHWSYLIESYLNKSYLNLANVRTFINQLTKLLDNSFI